MELEGTLLLLPMKVNETSIKTIKADTNTPIYIYIFISTHLIKHIKESKIKLFHTISHHEEPTLRPKSFMITMISQKIIMTAQT